jgi:thiamine pyrophosphate-dependent acetolactate synthase large subunit-like protein
VAAAVSTVACTVADVAAHDVASAAAAAHRAVQVAYAGRVVVQIDVGADCTVQVAAAAHKHKHFDGPDVVAAHGTRREHN